MKKIYLDYAAAAPLDPRVNKHMQKFNDSDFGNPQSIHSLGVSAREALEGARKSVSKILGGRKTEVIFTGGGTESVNLAILGLSRSIGRGEIITTAIEHPAVLEACRQLEKEGFKVKYVPVKKSGIVDPKDIEQEITDETILVSVMYANNEIGTIQPIPAIGRLINRLNAGRRQKIHFHTDACQAGLLDLNVGKLRVDLMSLNGGKIYGPKQSGVLYIKTATPIQPIIFGGGQENGLRGGTQNVGLSVGFSEALKLIQNERETQSTKLINLRDYFFNILKRQIPEAIINGDLKERLPNNVNITIPGIDGEAAVIYMDEKGFEISTGSACSSVKIEPSHVILALGKSKDEADASLRFSFGWPTKKSDIEAAVRALTDILPQVRNT